METETTKSSWDDLIFESRHKEYGAYPIRKSYDDNVVTGFFSALLFAAVVYAIVLLTSLLHVEINIPHPVLSHLTQLPPKIITEQPIKRTQVKAQPAAKSDLPVSVVTHEVEQTPVKPIDATSTTDDTALISGVPGEGAELNTIGDEIPTTVDAPKTLDFAQVMPQYTGGMEAMVRFLQRNLHYPATARSIEQEGIVFVRFVVNSNGQVVDVEVVKGVSAVLDKEAMRVVALMTKWKPGMQHDVPVNVRMVLPIKFQLEH